MTKDRLIIFGAQMVRATLEDRKTQTRRIIDVRKFGKSETHETIGGFITENGLWRAQAGKFNSFFPYPGRPCPYGVAGDRLWVRETLRQHNNFGFPLGDSPHRQSGIGERVWSYAADNHDPESKTGSIPSIHMPRWASRITLEITGVRVERLQDISGEDCKAEGINLDGELFPSVNWDDKLRERYRRLWDSIYGKPRRVYYEDDEGNRRWRIHPAMPWSSNPWVWVLEFKMVSSK